jgi:glycosyltransferase involved in cell wall biosynthesis
MTVMEMPEGQYFSATGMITASSAGQGRALLMRNRLLAQHAGVTPTLLTFDQTPHYPQVRRALREQGQLVEPMRLLNIYEWYREVDLDGWEPIGPALQPVSGFEVVESPHPDGTLYRSDYLQSRNRTPIVSDFRRSDGSVFLRVPVASDGGGPWTTVTLVNRKGQPVASWPNPRTWRQSWIVGLAEPGLRAFLICDSRFATPSIVPMPDARFHVVHVLHNLHVEDAWNSPLRPSYPQLFGLIGHLDGLVTLTHRQREDVAARYGATNNLFVVPNPVEPPVRPDPLPARDPKRFVIVARLEWQKRLEHAVEAFALVHQEEPEATLEIYGEGDGRLLLEKKIADLGVQARVVLHGHDPQARAALWRAGGFLMSSRFEGYPLATLESLSHGCPVISYDISYGPREQVTHGVNGFLVRPGDIRGMADAMLRLIRDPKLAASMSEAAFEAAGRHDHITFLEDWRRVLTAVAERRSRRTTLGAVSLKVTRLGHVRPVHAPDGLLRAARLPARFGRDASSSAAFRTARQIEFAGRLKVSGKSAQATLDDVSITLDALCDATAEVVQVPLQVRRSGKVFSLAASLDPQSVFGSMDDAARAMRLRLRLVWNNSSWETVLARPAEWAPNYEVSFSDEGALTLLRGRRSSGG